MRDEKKVEKKIVRKDKDTGRKEVTKIREEEKEERK